MGPFNIAENANKVSLRFSYILAFSLKLRGQYLSNFKGDTNYFADRGGW